MYRYDCIYTYFSTLKTVHIIVDCTTTQNQLSYHGIGKYTKHIVKGLIENDIDLTLLMFDGSSTIDEYIKRENVQVYRLGKVRPSDYKNIITYHTKILPAVRKVKKEDSIYFCPYFWSGIPSKHISTVLMVHDFILPIFNIYSEKGAIQNFIKKILYWIEMRKAKYCSAVITNSKYTAKDFRKYFPKYPKEKIFPIYLDVETDINGDTKGWDSKLPEDYKQRGYFIYSGGTLAKNKNSLGVIRGYREFLARVRNDKRAPYLVIAGKDFIKDVNTEAVRFRNIIKSLGLKEYVIFTGFYEDSHIKPLLQNSIASVHLSLYEGFGMSAVEAMRYGTPIIAHNGSCYPEIIGDAGILVDGRNEKEVGDAMYRVYSNQEFRSELIKKGEERAKLFSWENTVRETVKVFKSLTK